MPLALLALAIGAFGIGTTEFVPIGLLPRMADDFGVSVPTAGLLVTGYALGVAAGAPPMTALGTRITRKRMLVLLMGLFTVGNLISAAAPSFGVMLAGRVVTSLAHGAFFGIGSVVAADLVPPARRAGAIALMFTGLTVANVLGVPLGTFVGQGAGWRATFVVVAGLGVLGMAGVALLVPDLPRPAGVRLRHELAVFRNAQVLLALGMTVLGFGGVFAAITYLAPMMTDVAGFSDGAVTWLLVLLGLGMVAGNLAGGRFADRRLMPALLTSLGGLAVVLGAFAFTAHDKAAAAVTVFAVGALGMSTTAPLQKRVLDQAAGAPTLASAANIGAFNLGNALAAWLGGLVVSAGHSYTTANWIGVALAGGALLLAVWSTVLERGAARRPGRLVVRSVAGPGAAQVTAAADAAGLSSPESRPR